MVQDFHPIDHFTQFVQIANGVAVAIGIEKPPHGFSLMLIVTAAEKLRRGRQHYPH